MAGSVHWALIVVRGTLSSPASCARRPVNSVLGSSNTAGTAARGGLSGQALLLGAGGPLSRFQGPRFRQGMDRFNVRSDPLVRPAGPDGIWVSKIPSPGLSGAASGRSVFFTWSSYPHTELAEKALRVGDLPIPVREKVPVVASG